MQRMPQPQIIAGLAFYLNPFQIQLFGAVKVALARGYDGEIIEQGAQRGGVGVTPLKHQRLLKKRPRLIQPAGHAH